MSQTQDKNNYTTPISVILCTTEPTLQISFLQKWFKCQMDRIYLNKRGIYSG